MIRVKVGESSVDVWETPSGIEARASLYMHGSVLGDGERLELMNITFHAKDATEPATAGLVAMRLEQFADSALMMAKELRERNASK